MVEFGLPLHLLLDTVGVFATLDNAHLEMCYPGPNQELMMQYVSVSRENQYRWCCISTTTHSIGHKTVHCAAMHSFRASTFPATVILPHTGLTHQAPYSHLVLCVCVWGEVLKEHHTNDQHPL